MKFQRFKRILAGWLLGIGAFGLSVSAQEQPNWRITLQLADDVQVRAGIGTVPADAVKLDNRQALVRNVGYLQKNLPGGGSLRRILKLSNGRTVVYEVLIKRIEQESRFTVTVRPVNPTAQEAAQWGIDPARIETDFLREYQAPLLLNSGDILAIDVLSEPRTGAKFVDYYLISQGTPPLQRTPVDTLFSRAHEFSPADADLNIDGSEIRRNGRTVHENRERAVGGRFLWVEIPQVGRVILTLAPPAGESGFQRVAVVNKHQIVFPVGSDQYEWLSPRKIAPGSGTFFLWMRIDPTSSAGSGWEIGASPNVPPTTGKP